MNWNQNQQYPYGSNTNSTQQYQQQQQQQQATTSNTNTNTNTGHQHQHQHQQQPPFQSQSQYPLNSNSMPPAYPFSQQHGVQQHQHQPPPPAYPMYSSAGQNQIIQSTTTAAYTTASTAQMYPQHTQQQQPGPPNYSSYPSVSEPTSTSMPAYGYNYNYGQPQPQPQTQTFPPPPPPPKQQQTVPKTQTEKTTENEHQHHCDTCTVSFPNQKALQAHLNSHIKCSKCPFTASKRVVSAHFKANHGEYAGRGLKTISIQMPGNRSIQKFKICVGNHPDDIQAWREERKRRFPTRDNLKKKMDKCKRNRDEGAVGFGALRNDNGTGTGTGNDEGKKQRMNGDAVASIVAEKSDVPVSSISNLIAGYGSSSDEDEVEKKDGTGTSTQKLDAVVDIQKCKEVSMQTNSTATGNDPSSTFKTKFCRYFLRNGTCKNGDECTYIHDMAKREAYKTNAGIKKQKQSQRDRARNEAQKEMNVITTGRTKGRAGHGAAPQTLLRKLLQNDIRRERSLALQLLRYVVDCNYLQEKREGQLNSET